MPTTARLRDEAKEDHDLAITKMAAALALEDGVINTKQAGRLVNLQKNEDPLAVMQSDAYPGDKYFDLARHKIEG